MGRMSLVEVEQQDLETSQRRVWCTRKRLSEREKERERERERESEREREGRSMANWLESTALLRTYCFQVTT